MYSAIHSFVCVHQNKIFDEAVTSTQEIANMCCTSSCHTQLIKIICKYKCRHIWLFISIHPSSTIYHSIPWKYRSVKNILFIYLLVHALVEETKQPYDWINVSFLVIHMYVWHASITCLRQTMIVGCTMQLLKADLFQMHKFSCIMFFTVSFTIKPDYGHLSDNRTCHGHYHLQKQIMNHFN